MASGKRDANFIVVGMGVSSVDGITPVPITVDPDTGRLRVLVSSNTGNLAVPDRAVSRRDENREPTIAGEHNTTSAYTPFSLETGGYLMLQRA